jgi:hypothetical protein
MALGGVWIPVTLLASSAQTLRNAMQRDLIGALGAVAAAQVRFLFGLPFALVFLAGVLVRTSLHLPRLTAVNLGWTAFGAASQVIATALMLAAMRTKSFVVAVAYTKTEAAQIALFGLIALNNPRQRRLLRRLRSRRSGLRSGDPQPEGANRRLAIGRARTPLGDLLRLRLDRFPLSCDWRREPFASLGRVGDSGCGIGDSIRGAWALSRRLGPRGARAIIDAWRSSLFAGFMGALASQLWFVAFALSEAAPVRTLALIEVPMAQVVSLKMFREPPSLREGLGMSLIVIATRILVWTAR